MLTLADRTAERMTAAALTARANVPFWLRRRLATLEPGDLIDVTWVQLHARRECLDFTICDDPTIAPRVDRPIDPWTGD